MELTGAERVLIFWNGRGELDEKDFASLGEAVSFVELENSLKETPEPASFRQGGKVVAAWSEEKGLRTLDEVLQRLKKFLDTARYAGTGDGTISEAEVDLATSRAQALLAEFNVDAATIDAMHDPRIPTAERRIQHQCNRPSTYEWQKRLWNTLAHVNFCLHYTKSIIKDIQVPDPRELQYCWSDEERAECRKIWVSKVVGKRHELIGRESNVMSVEVLGNYIEDAILRMSPYPVTHKSANSWKMGCSERIRERLLAKKRHMEKEQISLAGPSSSTAIALRDVFKSEYDQNIDTLYGEGTAARWAAEEREAAEEKARLEERAEMVQDHPECFSREEYNEVVQKVARVRKAAESMSKRRGRASNSYWDGVDYNAWYEGQAAGDKIGLDVQVKSTNATLIEG